jgi:hypothetical protein
MLQYINEPQNSEAWLKARMGMPTASAFSKILAKGEDKVRRTYLMTLACERLTGRPDPGWGGNEHTERGHAMEGEARDMYAFQAAADLTEVGFITDGKKGCSPDRLIGEDGGLEIKTALPHILGEILLKNEVPTTHTAQVQGSMWVCKRQWWDVAIYFTGMPIFIKRVHRDEAYIQTLATEVDKFTADLNGVVAQLTALQGRRAA